MRALFLLTLVMACGEPPATTAPPADPAAAPPPTETQQGGAPAAEVVIPEAPTPTTDKGLAAACTSAMRTFPDQPSIRSSNAGELNSLGYDCYRAGRLADARHLFLLALRADNNHALAHYNLACTLMRLRAESATCEYEAGLATVMHHLERSVAIDARRRTRMQEDPDLDGLRDNLRYRMLLGVRMGDPDSMRKALAGTTVYGPGMGAFGSLRTLTFEGTGDGGARSRVRIRTRTVGEDGLTEPTERLGYWDAQHGRLTIKLPRGVEGGGTLTLTPQGDLLDATGTTTVWYTAPSECDA